MCVCVYLYFSFWLLIFPATFFFFSISAQTHRLRHLERISSFFCFCGGCVCLRMLHFEKAGPPPPSLSPGLPALHSSIFLSTFFSYLLLYVIAKSLLSALLSSPLLPLSLFSFYTHPLLSLSVSLFCDCCGWSPRGTPCRVPNLFIISALCRDARGMLKYEPTSLWVQMGCCCHRPSPPTRPLGWTGPYVPNPDASQKNDNDSTEKKEVRGKEISISSSL